MKKIITKSVGALIVLLGCASMFLINDRMVTGSMSLAVLLVLMGYQRLSIAEVSPEEGVDRTSKGNKRDSLFLSIPIITQVLWFISRQYVFLCITQIVVIIIGIVIWLRSMKGYNRLFKVINISLLLGSGVLALGLMITAITPLPFIYFMGVTTNMTSSDPQETITTVLESGASYTNDIEYVSKYGDNYLDIYIAQDTGVESTMRPTFVYFHGGGYVWGDKYAGDPNAETGGFDWYFQSILDAGYNIVSVNYALAPEVPYPVPIIQGIEALTFLADNDMQYGLNMDEVILSGSSAGGHLAAQLAAVLTNKAYADELNITSTYEGEKVMAVVPNSALLDISRFGISDNGNAVLDYIWYQCGRTYFKSGMPEVNTAAMSANVINNVNEDYPPTFITDGNAGSFADQAKDLSARLEELGTISKLYITDLNDGETPHAYEVTGTEFAQENMRLMLEFLGELVLTP